MTSDELERCTQLLIGYFPNHPWTDQVWLVWIEALDPIEWSIGVNAIRALGRSAEFPTVAGLLQCIDAATPSPAPVYYEALPAARVDTDTSKKFIAEARRRAAEARGEADVIPLKRLGDS